MRCEVIDPGGIPAGVFIWKGGGGMKEIAFLGGTIGPVELLVVLTAVLLLFGPSRLPDLARRMGQFMNQLRDASDEVRRQVLNPPEEHLPVAKPDSRPAAERDSSPEVPHDRVG